MAVTTVRVQFHRLGAVRNGLHGKREGAAGLESLGRCPEYRVQITEVHECIGRYDDVEFTLVSIEAGNQLVDDQFIVDFPFPRLGNHAR